MAGVSQRPSRKHRQREGRRDLRPSRAWSAAFRQPGRPRLHGQPVRGGIAPPNRPLARELASQDVAWRRNSFAPASRRCRAAGSAARHRIEGPAGARGTPRALVPFRKRMGEPLDAGPRSEPPTEREPTARDRHPANAHGCGVCGLAPQQVRRPRQPAARAAGDAAPHSALIGAGSRPGCEACAGQGRADRGGWAGAGSVGGHAAGTCDATSGLAVPRRRGVRMGAHGHFRLAPSHFRRRPAVSVPGEHPPHQQGGRVVAAILGRTRTWARAKLDT